jgi:threonine/homoserine/homoserine lactone efflux protein
MTAQLYVSFIMAALLFILIPGPSVCFTIAHGLRHGIWRTVPTILGQAAANILQLVVIVFGLRGILAQSPVLFSGLKMVGAVYLIYIGIKIFSAPEPVLKSVDKSRVERALNNAINGFIVCGTNPKALLYYAAFLPQFIAPQGDKNSQFIILGASSVLITILVLLFYALLAGQARYWLIERGFWRMQTRSSGALIIAAGAALGFADSR